MGAATLGMEERDEEINTQPLLTYHVATMWPFRIKIMLKMMCLW